MSSHRSAARRRIASKFAARHDAEPLARLAPQPHAHAVADVELHDLLAVVEQANAAVGHHAVDVAENQLDLATGVGEGHVASGDAIRRRRVAAIRRTSAATPPLRLGKMRTLTCGLRRLRRLGGFAGPRASASALRPTTSVTSTSPTGRPLLSTTGSSLNFRCRQQRDRVADARAAGHRRRLATITSANRPIERRFVAPLEQPGQVAIGEQARQPAGVVGEHDRAGAPARLRAGHDHLRAPSGRRSPCGIRRAAA